MKCNIPSLLKLMRMTRPRAHGLRLVTFTLRPVQMADPVDPKYVPPPAAKHVYHREDHISSADYIFPELFLFRTYVLEVESLGF